MEAKQHASVNQERNQKKRFKKRNQNMHRNE